MTDKKIKIPEQLKSFVIKDVKQRFHKVNAIAKGSQGTVWQAVDDQNIQYAIKEIDIIKDKLNIQAKRYLLECASLMRAQHPFIVTFCGMTDEYPFQIITEYVSLVNLTTFLVDKHFRTQSNNGNHLTKIAMSISNAMMFLHKIKLIHRDLKPSNILIDKKYLPKICDFGLVAQKDENSMMTAELGTPIWMAPEVIRGESYTEKCDVFSFAMILYQMATKKLPLAELSPNQIMEKYKNESYRPPFPRDTKISKAFQDLIAKCWDDNPNNRPSFDLIFQKFANFEVYFPRADSNEILKFANELKVADANRKIIPEFPVFEKKKHEKEVDQESKKDKDEKGGDNKKDDKNDNPHEKKEKPKVDGKKKNEDESVNSNKKITKKKKNQESSESSEEEVRGKPKAKKSKRESSESSEEEVRGKPKTKKSKRESSDDIDKNRKKKKKVKSDSESESDGRNSKNKRNVGNRNSSDSDSQVKRKIKKRNHDDDYESDDNDRRGRKLKNKAIIDNKKEKIFDVDTFKTTKKKTQQKTQISDPSYSSSYDYSSGKAQKNYEKSPKFKSHITKTRQRKPAPTFRYVQESTESSQNEYTSSSYEEKRRKGNKNEKSKYYPIKSPKYTSNTPINIETLYDIQNPMFQLELEKVKPKNFQAFIKVLKKHLTSRIPNKELILLLKKTLQLLENDDCLSIFSQKGIFEFLPISKSNRNERNSITNKKSKCSNESESDSSSNIEDDDEQTENDEVLDISIDILFQVFRSYPQFIEENFETSMISLINQRPIESSKLLRIYSASFDLIENPWTLLDMMIKYKKRFDKNTSGSIVIRTIVYLIKTFENYKKNRLKNCRTLITFFLNSKIKSNVISAYKAITTLYDDNFDLPYKKIRIDLEDPEYVNFVIALFDKMNNIPSVKSIIVSLLKTAQKNESVIDILTKMAKDYESAFILINNQDLWMDKKIPTYLDTLKLFKAATFDYPDLKKIVISDPFYIANLFLCSCKSRQKEKSFLCYEKILENYKFKEIFIECLQENNFFNNFFRSFVEICYCDDNDHVILACLRSFKYFNKIGNCEDLKIFTKTLRKLASEDDEIGEEAQSCLDLIKLSNKKIKAK